MPQTSVMSCAAAGAAACAAVVGGCHLASAFIAPTASGASVSRERAALRGTVASEQASSLAKGAASLATWGTAAVVAAAAGRTGTRRTARHAEPVSAAAAAAAAAKAAGAVKGAGAVKAASAAKAATETGTAVAGAGGTSMLSKGDGKTVAGKEPKKPQVFDPANEIGVTQPLGYFDPAGFCKKGDAQGFRNLRVAEIKHARVAMMAAVGAVVQHYVKFPGFEKVPAGLSAVLAPPGNYGFVALFALTGILELSVWTEDGSKEPGNFGDPLGLNMYTPDMRDKELNNGRAAMFAAIGIIAAELATGKDAIEQLGLQ